MEDTLVVPFFEGICGFDCVAPAMCCACFLPKSHAAALLFCASIGPHTMYRIQCIRVYFTEHPSTCFIRCFHDSDQLSCLGCVVGEAFIVLISCIHGRYIILPPSFMSCVMRCSVVRVWIHQVFPASTHEHLGRRWALRLDIPWLRKKACACAVCLLRRSRKQANIVETTSWGCLFVARYQQKQH